MAANTNVKERVPTWDPTLDIIHGSPFRARPLPRSLAIGPSKLRHPICALELSPTTSTTAANSDGMTAKWTWPYKSDNDDDLELAVWTTGIWKLRSSKVQQQRCLFSVRHRAVMRRWEMGLKATCMDIIGSLGWIWVAPRLTQLTRARDKIRYHYKSAMDHKLKKLYPSLPPMTRISSPEMPIPDSLNQTCQDDTQRRAEKRRVAKAPLSKRQYIPKSSFPVNVLINTIHDLDLSRELDDWVAGVAAEKVEIFAKWVLKERQENDGRSRGRVDKLKEQGKENEWSTVYAPSGGAEDPIITPLSAHHLNEEPNPARLNNGSSMDFLNTTPAKSGSIPTYTASITTTPFLPGITREKIGRPREDDDTHAWPSKKARYNPPPAKEACIKPRVIGMIPFAILV